MSEGSILIAQKKFRSKVKVWIAQKGMKNVEYLKEYIQGHENPVALGVTELTKEQMINIINGVLSDKEVEAYAKRES